jgi:integrase
LGFKIAGLSLFRPIHVALSPRTRAQSTSTTAVSARASELRGLRWADVDLEKRELHVRQRADRFNEFGKPKSESGGCGLFR